MPDGAEEVEVVLLRVESGSGAPGYGSAPPAPALPTTGAPASSSTVV